jgi:hypothetical protein
MNSLVRDTDYTDTCHVAVNRRLVVRLPTIVPYVTGLYFKDADKLSRAVGDLTRPSIEVTPAL